MLSEESEKLDTMRITKGEDKMCLYGMEMGLANLEVQTLQL